MKQCDYCAKEIDYSRQYCCDDCEKKAQIFFNKGKRSEKIVSVVNIIAFFGIIVGGLCGVIFNAKDGFIVCAAMLLLLGILYLIFPFAPENIIHKYKIKCSIFMIRTFATAMIVISAILFIVGFLVV